MTRAMLASAMAWRSRLDGSQGVEHIVARDDVPRQQPRGPQRAVNPRRTPTDGAARAVSSLLEYCRVATEENRRLMQCIGQAPHTKRDKIQMLQFHKISFLHYRLRLGRSSSARLPKQESLMLLLPH